MARMISWPGRGLDAGGSSCTHYLPLLSRLFPGLWHRQYNTTPSPWCGYLFSHILSIAFPFLSPSFIIETLNQKVFHNVTKRMSPNIGHRLYAIFREAAGPFFLRDIRTSLNAFSLNSSSSNSTTRGFFARNYSGKIPPGTGKISRRFASGSFLVLGASPHSAAAVETGATCAISPEKIICPSSPCYPNRRPLGSLARHIWKRSVHTSENDRSAAELAKARSSAQNESSPQEAVPVRPHDPVGVEGKHLDREYNEPVPPNRNLREHLPNLPQFHRPTKEELLAAATGFWSRLRVRFKWFSIRSVRPFNLDEISALFSWVLLGHVLWIILGTTTFFSLIIFAINTVFAQGMLPSSTMVSIMF